MIVILITRIIKIPVNILTLVHRNNENINNYEGMIVILMMALRIISMIILMVNNSTQAAEFNFRNQLKTVKKKEFSMDEEEGAAVRRRRPKKLGGRKKEREKKLSGKKKFFKKGSLFLRSVGGVWVLFSSEAALTSKPLKCYRRTLPQLTQTSKWINLDHRRGQGRGMGCRALKEEGITLAGLPNLELNNHLK